MYGHHNHNGREQNGPPENDFTDSGTALVQCKHTKNKSPAERVARDKKVSQVAYNTAANRFMYQLA